jgi:hypothetical protein
MNATQVAGIISIIFLIPLIGSLTPFLAYIINITIGAGNRPFTRNQFITAGIFAAGVLTPLAYILTTL